MLAAKLVDTISRTKVAARASCPIALFITQNILLLVVLVEKYTTWGKGQGGAWETRVSKSTLVQDRF
jgi:hypothetical protein